MHTIHKNVEYDEYVEYDDYVEYVEYFEYDEYDDSNDADVDNEVLQIHNPVHGLQTWAL